MKKLLILLLVMVLSTGCSIVRIDQQQITSIIDIILKEDNQISNTVLEGYKYYLPKGVSTFNKVDYNTILLDNRNYYYLYVDVVSYYHKQENTYQVNPNAYFSKRIDANGKTGYIEINRSNHNYFIEAVYHYAKIEAYVKESELKNAVSNIMTILSSVSYQDQVLSTFVGDRVLNHPEEQFDLFKPKREEGEFLQIVQEYGTYHDVDNELPDEDQIQIDEEVK